MEIDLDSELGLISEADYASFLGHTIESVRNARSLGRSPPFVKIGKTIKYRLADIREFVARHTVDPSSKRAGTLVSGGDRSPRKRRLATCVSLHVGAAD